MNIDLITGGARSGKSAYAEQRAAELGGSRVTYIATAQALDAEMRQRIAAHQRGRPDLWQTIEATRNTGHALAHARHDVVLIDCLTLLVSNVLLQDSASAVEREITELLEAAARRDGRLIVVTNEVGLGIVPDNALARSYRDALGLANQRVASAAAAVTLMVSGLPLALKTEAAAQPAAHLHHAPGPGAQTP
jgi:adenosylcobinamide kinase / adenosylcobinamide-phosphate guanylyltransferase